MVEVVAAIPVQVPLSVITGEIVVAKARGIVTFVLLL